jgi:hypothetical protein
MTPTVSFRRTWSLPSGDTPKKGLRSDHFPVKGEDSR